jgi:CheY-like chemotaxis protein
MEGYDVSTASNGLLALESARASPPDMIITDWMMPIMDGAELCRRLRAMPRFAHVPILVHTAVPPLDAVGKNWNVCVRKPVGADKFLAMVAQMCKHAH